MKKFSRLALWALIGLMIPVQGLFSQDHQITLFRNNRAGAVTFSFDDGYYSQLTNAVPLLNARGMRATFFVTTNLTEVSWTDWRDLAAQGHEIASHSLTHLDLTTLTDPLMGAELRDSQLIVNQNVPSQSCLSFAYPYANSDARVRAAAGDLYIASRGSWSADQGGDFNFYADMEPFYPTPPDVHFGSFKALDFNNTAGDGAPYSVPISTMDLKLDAAVTYHAWYVMYLHTIPDDTSYFAALVDHVAARNLWVAPFREVALYMRERLASSLNVLSSDASMIRLTLTNTLDGRYDEPLTLRSVVPATWTTVHVTQGASFVAVDSVVEGPDRVVYYDALPNDETIVLSSSQNQAALGSVSLSPAIVPGGTASTGMVTMTGPAPAGGAVVSLTSSDTAVAQVPAAVTVAAGATAATFTATTSGVTLDTAVTITATYGGVVRTATVTAMAPLAVLSSISMNPVTVGGGTSSLGTVTLDRAAPIGGAVVTLTSDSTTVAQVPASVTVAAGMTTATFTATTTPVAFSAPVTITAIFNSASRTATLTVTPPVLISISLAPTSALGGSPSTGTVTLSGPAPFGGTQVSLSSSNTAAAQVPAAMTVAAGATTATFTATTVPVSADTPVTLTAALNSVNRTTTLTVTPPVLASVGLAPTSVVGGSPSTGTVTLSGPAPTGGTMVGLSSSNTAAAQVPASVTVASGATTATFTATTSPVAANASVTITAVLSGVNRTATLTVTTPVLASVGLAPTSVLGGSSSTGTVTLSGPAPTGGTAVTLTSDSTTVAQVPASVSVAAGTTTATFTATTSPVAANASVTIAAVLSGVNRTATLTVTPPTLASVGLVPTSVVGSSLSTGTVTLSGPAPTGGTVVGLSSSNTAAAQVPASVTVAAGATTATFTATTSPVSTSTSVTIAAVLNSIDRTATLTVTPPALASVGLVPTSVMGSSPATGTVTLSGPAPTGGTVVGLSSSNTAAAQVPASVTVAAGATTATFTATTNPVASNTPVTIAAAFNGVDRTATLTVTPPVLASVGLVPPSVVGGNPSTGTVTLSGPAPTGGTVVSLSSSDTAAAQVTASVTVAAGATTATFTATTNPVASNTPVTITAAFNGVDRTAALTVTAPVLTSVALAPPSVVGGSPSTGTVTLASPAPAGGVAISLSSSNSSAAQVPPSVTVAAGATTATFVAATIPVVSNTPVTITAAFNSVDRTAALTVTPPALASVGLTPTLVVGGNASTGSVTLSGPAPPGGTVVGLSSSDTAAAQVPPSVTVAAGATTATFSTTTNPVGSNAAVTITAVFSGVSRTATLTVTAPGLASVAVDPTSVVGGDPSTGTVTLDNPAPAGGVVVNLSSNDAAVVQVPASVTVAAGATTATFAATTVPVISNAFVTITAVFNGVGRTATMTVAAPVLAGVGLSPASVVGGHPSTGTVTLGTAAPAGGALITLSSNNTTAAQVPASVTVAAGATAATFTATTSPVGVNASVTVTAAFNGVNQTATLTVTAPVLTSVGLIPNSVPGGLASTGTVTLDNPAPAGGALITLSSNNTAAAQVPASVTVAAGATTADFAATTVPVVSNALVTITAVFNGVSRTAALTVAQPVLSSAELVPASVVGGSPSTGTVTLASAAPAGGAVVTLNSSDPAVAQVPPSVTVAAGATAATFTTTTSPVGANASVSIAAAYNGVTRTAVLTVAAPVLTSIGLVPASVVGGHPSTGTVSLSGPAPTGGAVIMLISSNTDAAQVPASVTVAAGATAANFTATTDPVASDSAVTITADFDGVSRTAVLTVAAPVLTSIGLVPNSLLGGSSSTGTVTLDHPAPVGGAVVALASSDTSAAEVPPSVTVAAGATTANFAATTNPVASTTSVTISAVFNSVTRTVDLTVAPAGLTSVGLVPNTVLGGNPSTGTVTLNGPAPAGGAEVTLSSSNTALAQPPATVTVAAGATTATFTMTTVPTGSNSLVTITAAFEGVSRTAALTVTAPVLTSVGLVPNWVLGGSPSTGTITLSGPAPTGGAAITLSSSNTVAAQLPASVTVEAGATTATFAAATAPVSAETAVTITAVFNGASQTAILTVTPAGLTSIGLVPNTVLGGNPSTGTVSLNGPAPTGGAVVALSSSNTALAQLPATVTVAAGTTTATFTATTVPVGSDVPVTITAAFEGVSRTATLTVTAPVLSSVGLVPASVLGGNPSTGTVTLDNPAPAGGAVVTLTSSSPGTARVPTSVTVAPGTTTATFTATTVPVIANTQVTVMALFNSVSRAAILTVQAAPPVDISTFTLVPTSVVGGSPSTATVTLTGPAPPGGAVVSLNSSLPSAVQVPASVTVEAGATSASFAVTTSPVAARSVAQVSATYRGRTMGAAMTANPPVLATLSLDPNPIRGGSPCVGTVTLTGPAPAGGTTIMLSSSHTRVAKVPASVTVRPGQSSANFTISTAPVPYPRTAKITAKKDGTTIGVVLTAVH